MEDLTILIVDDDNTTTSILDHMLQGRRCANAIIKASNGQEGLDLYFRYKPDIILSDINMPIMNGLEMIQEIRKVDEHVKIAIFTDFEKREILVSAIELGVNQFISKPFDKNIFSKIILQLYTGIIEKRSIQKELKRKQNILQSINGMSHNFLQQSDWMIAIEEEMNNLKNAIEVSSLFIYKNFREKNNIITKEFLSLSPNKKISPPKSIHYTRDNLRRWKKLLEQHLPINGAIEEYSLSEKKILFQLSVKSLLILPIFVKKVWWGFLAIGDESREVIKEENVGLLSTAASIIGAAINNAENLKSMQMSATVFDHTIDGVLITDAKNNIIHINEAFVKITGYSADFVLGKNPSILQSGNHDKHFYQKMWDRILEEGSWNGEITNRKRSGEIYIESLSVNTIKDNRGQIENFIGIFSDVTHHRKDAQNNAYLATHDPLTGLSNRLLLNDRLSHAIDHAKRFQKCISVIFCDLDDFKPINDNFGHSAGDEILKSVSLSLKNMLRKEDTVCRFGGDEFVILIEDMQSLTYLKMLLHRVKQIVEEPIKVDDNLHKLGMSIGVAVYPKDGETVKALMDSADNAMYKAKEAGKNTIKFAQEDHEEYCKLWEEYTI